VLALDVILGAISAVEAVRRNKAAQHHLIIEPVRRNVLAWHGPAALMTNSSSTMQEFELRR
jgi:hypothetical protein